MKQLQDLLYSAALTRFGPEIIQSSLPSIRLKAQKISGTQQKLGITKFGGAPDCPVGYLWPERNRSPLPFVAQINLADITPYDTNHILPATGRLHFFFDIDAFFESDSSDAPTWTVQYDTSPLSDLQYVTIPEAISQKSSYYPCTITCSSELTLPDYSQYDSTSMQRLGISQPLTDAEEQAYYKVQEQLAGTEGNKYHTAIHRLLGHPDDVQWDMHGDLEGPPTDWLHLLQIDSDGAPDTNWGDTGRIYYWIRSRDLARGDFSQTQLILQSS